MAVRIQTLAKELNLSNKELLAILRDNGIRVSSHLTAIHAELAFRVRDAIAERAGLEVTPVDEADEALPGHKAKKKKSKKKVSKKAAAAPAAEPEAKPAEAAPEEKPVVEAAPRRISVPPITAKPVVAKVSPTPAAEPEPAVAATPEPTAPVEETTPVVETAPAAAADSDTAKPSDAKPVAAEATADSAETPATDDKSANPAEPKQTGKKIFIPSTDMPKRAPIVARRGPIIARSKTPTPSPERTGSGNGDAGRSGKARFFPGQSDFTPAASPGGGGGSAGGGPGGPGGARGRGRGGAPHGRGGGGRGGPGGRRGGRRGGRGEGHVGFQRKRETLAADRPSEVSIQMPVTLKELSSAIGVRQPLIMKALLQEGVMVNINSHLTEEMMLAIGLKFEVEIQILPEEQLESTLEELETTEGHGDASVARAPVVTFLGHVDHGKTSLLDKIRETKVASGEAGGITQHMSAYRVDDGDKHVVFIDTPGHKAFTEMRARGANVTDVVVLVCAADDGPMPQTEEAIQHARAAGVPIVVAINKIDRPNANLDRTRTALASLDLAPVDWGGTTEMIPVSAITGEGIDNLLEVLSLETEILDLRADPTRPAIGTILDSKNTTGRGIVTTALVQEGTLRVGDYVLCGPAWGRVRTMSNTTGTPITEAGPSTPIEVTGLDDLPGAGDRLYVIDQSKARAIAEERKRKIREQERAQRSHVTLETLISHLETTQIKEVNLIIKADVKGSLEVVRKQLEDLATEEVGFKILLAHVGEITESDVLLADASDAIVLGFHVVANDRARQLADEKGVEIRCYQVIYQLIEDMQNALEGMLEPELYEEIQATAEIRELFKSTRLGNIAGSMVTDGVLKRENPVRLIRDGSVIHTGALNSLKRFKEDTNEVKEGFECGIRIEQFNEVMVGDIVESYAILKKKRKLGDS